jgi:hypothetical protein
MADQPKAYERLSRSRFFLNGTGSLWLGKDHLLQVTNTFAVEHYRRWYLREIQAFVIRRTNGRMIWNIVFGVLLLLVCAIAAASVFGAIDSSSADDRVGFWIATGILGLVGLGLLALLLINTAMGPTCVVFVQTPHGLDRVSSPRRIHAFENLATRIQPMIESVQTPAEKDHLHEVAASLTQPV